MAELVQQPTTGGASTIKARILPAGRDVSRGQIAVCGFVKMGCCQVSRFSCEKKCNVFLLVFSGGVYRCGDGVYRVNSCFGLKGRISHRSVQRIARLFQISDY